MLHKIIVRVKLHYCILQRLMVQVHIEYTVHTVQYVQYCCFTTTIVCIVLLMVRDIFICVFLFKLKIKMN